MSCRHSALLLGAAILAAPACADPLTNVTLYGVLDDAFVHVSNQNGLSNNYFRNGNYSNSKIGFKGNEDLGGGTSALFVLEAGYDINTGAAQQSGSLFNRQAYVGLRNDRLGQVTVGRGYTPYYLLVGTLAMDDALTGATGAHPGDYDDLDIVTRVSNNVTYTTPKVAGLVASVLAGSGEVAGHNGAGSTYSAALRYDHARWQVGAGYLMMKNGVKSGVWDPASSASFASSPVNTGYLSAASIQHIAIAARYALTPHWTLMANASNSQFRPGAASLFKDTALFNSQQAIVTWHGALPFSLSAGYSYTKAHAANGIHDPANYRQLSLEELFPLSKRTVIYVTQAYQKARGQTLGADGSTAVNAVAAVGDAENSTPSNSPSQHVLMLGISHSF